MNNENMQNEKEVQKLKTWFLYFGFLILAVTLGTIVYNLVKTVKHPAKKKPEEVMQTVNPHQNWFRDRKIALQPRPLPIAKGGESNAAASQAAAENNHDYSHDQQAEEDKRNAMKAPINSNQIISANVNNGTSLNSLSSEAIKPENDQQNNSTLANKDNQSLADEKRTFITENSRQQPDILSSTVMKPVAPLVLNWGTLLPAKLDKQINSDLPGQIYAHITRDVYDSRTHDKLLIPAGSQIVGSYDSAIAYGQDRLLVAWKRINFPNGQWLDLQGMGGADPAGSGFGDVVDNHYWRIFGSTALISVLAAGAQLSQPQQGNVLQVPSVGQTLGQAAGTQIANTGTMLLQKNIDLKPTITIRAGFDFQIEVNKDIVFPSIYTGNPNK